MITDTLRPPPLLDPTAVAYKDWLHLNVFDHATGCIGIFNASLHGSPHDRRSRAMGTALAHVPDVGWVGNVEVAGISDANIGATSISLERVALATEPIAGTVLASARFARDGFEAGLTAMSQARAIDIELPLPLGSGWISWYVVPRLSVEGGLIVGNRRIDLRHASAYHDHNWGRWHWGDDLGWEWGACHAEDPAITLVLSRTSNRAHSNETGTMVVVDAPGERRTFSGPRVRVDYHGRLATEMKRLPGALAALHQDRIVAALPASIVVQADDGVDAVTVDFQPRAAAQLIGGDPARRGYGFLHEMVGEFEMTGRIAGRTVAARGLAVFEHVN